MKKINLLFSLLVLTFYSCNDNEVVPDRNDSYNKKHYSHINHGKIHNDFMSFINNDFIISKDIATKSDAYNSVSSFFKDKLKSYQDVEEKEKSLLSDSFERNIFLLDTANLQSIIKNETNIENRIRGGYTTLRVLLDDLRDVGAISNQEFEKIISLQYVLSKVYNGEMGITELSSYLNQEANHE